MKIHFYVNGLKPHARTMHTLLAAHAARYGIREADGFDADAVVALGGDGTLLKAVREFPGVPVLGLNLGGLGYLASVGEADFDLAIKCLAEGDFRVGERTMLRLVSDAAEPVVALNDVVVVREMSGHAARLDLSVDGCTATRYMADGLVVATPTGSTAYSLSAGGPVLMPDSACLVVTPMNPHALGIRPLVLSDGVRLAVTSRPRADGSAETLGVYADGERVRMLRVGESVELARADVGARLVELPGYDPYDVLARKLGWTGTQVP